MSNSDIQAAAAGPAPVKRTKLILPMVIVVVVAVLLVGGILGFKIFAGMKMGKAMAAMGQAPQTVSTAVAAATDWQAESQAVGNVRALRGADLAAQAAGIVDKIEFESGNEVAAGATLLRLRLNDDAAKLDQLEAAAVLAAQTLKRDLEQFAAQAISQATVDSDAATLRSAQAQVAAQRAIIDEKILRAPFAGRLGIRQVDEGQYLSAGTAIVTLQSVDPIVIDFYVPQQSLAALKSGQAVSAAVDAYPGQAFKGQISSINSKVDSGSRNVQVRATFRNPERHLIPGMYATVKIANGAPQKLVTIPQAAITYNPFGDTVFVVDPAKGAAAQRFVELGATRGDQIAVLKGLNAGDVVVTGGQMKLRNGSRVTVDNSVVPANDAAPTPPNE